MFPTAAAPAAPVSSAGPSPTPWYVTAPYGLSMAMGAAVAVLGFAPKVSWADALMVVGGLALLFTPMAAATGALRCQESPEGRAKLATALAFAAVVSLPVLALVAAVLKAVTHHRGLGGVTFAAFGVVLVAGAVVAGGRVAHWAALRPNVLTWARRSLVAVAVAITLASVVSAGWLRSGRLDVVLLCCAPILGGWAPLIRSSRIGLVSWAITAVGGLVALGLALGRPLGAGIAQDVPLVGGVLAAARSSAGGEAQSEESEAEGAPPAGAAPGAAPHRAP